MACCPTCHQEIPPLQVFIDVISRALVRGERSAKLTPGEMRIMQMLIAVAPNVITKERFLLAIYDGDEPEWGENCLRLNISRIRRKIAGMGLDIRTNWGGGYSLHADPETMRAAKLATPRRGAA